MKTALALRSEKYTDDQLRATRALLLDRACELKDRVTRVAGNLRREGVKPSRDFSDIAILEENDEILRGIEKTARAELTHIDHALERIDEGTFAICELCGKEIEAERLDVAPYASECGGCARKS